jgi:hypothetical protein
MKFKVFWDVAPCSHEVDRCFRDAYCLHHRPDDGRLYAPLEHQSTSTRLQGATSQKTLNFNTRYIHVLLYAKCMFVAPHLILFAYGALCLEKCFTDIQ